MKLADLYPYVLPHLIGVPLPMVDLYIRQAARTFFLGTHAWVMDVDAFVYQDDASEYDLGISPGAEVAKVLSVTSGDADYTKNVRLVGDDTLMFDEHSGPGNGATVDVQLALAPRVGDPAKTWSLPADLDRFVPELANGTLAEAFAKVDGQAGLAKFYGARFANDINTCGLKESRKRSGRRVSRGTTTQFF